MKQHSIHPLKNGVNFAAQISFPFESEPVNTSLFVSTTQTKHGIGRLIPLHGISEEITLSYTNTFLEQ